MAGLLDRISWLLGFNLGGWADLIEDMGDKAPEVYCGVLDQLRQREMPDIQVGETEIQEGFLSNLRRHYIEVKTYPGTRTLVFVEKHGRDLFVSWKCFAQVALNWRLLLSYAGISLGISVIIAAIFYVVTMASGLTMVTQEMNWDNFFIALGFWVLYGTVIGVVLAVLVNIIGGVLSAVKKDKRFCARTCSSSAIYLVIGLVIGFFINTPGQSMNTQFATLNSILGQGMPFLAAAFSIIPVAFMILEGILVLAVVLGFVFRRNLLSFIFKEQSIFDGDDIQAMNMSVDKSIRRALDLQGFDISKLRLKREFKSGRNGDVV